MGFGSVACCCNSCKHKLNNLYGCSKPKTYCNGFSKYEPNEELNSRQQNYKRKGHSFNE